MKRYCTSGINIKIPENIQIMLWSMYDTMEIEKDYLQIFELSEKDGMQKIKHIQEVPPYEKEYLFKTDIPFLFEKIYIIAENDYQTMLLSSEY